MTTTEDASDSSAVILRCTVEASLRELRGEPCCERCKGRGMLRKFSGWARCYDCDGTGAPTKAAKA